MGQGKGGAERALGQFRAVKCCPVCLEDNGESKWTCVSCTQLVSVHRELLRNLQQWRSMFEAMEASDVLVGLDGRSYVLWDLQRFYAHREILPARQSMAIQYCLFENMKEADAAVRMGIKATNPVSVYATIGLTSLLAKAVTDDLPGYFIEINPVEVSV